MYIDLQIWRVHTQIVDQLLEDWASTLVFCICVWNHTVTLLRPGNFFFCATAAKSCHAECGAVRSGVLAPGTVPLPLIMHMLEILCDEGTGKIHQRIIQAKRAPSMCSMWHFLCHLDHVQRSWPQQCKLPRATGCGCQTGSSIVDVPVLIQSRERLGCNAYSHRRCYHVSDLMLNSGRLRYAKLCKIDP